MELLKYFQQQQLQQDIIAFLRTLVELESPSSDKNFVNRCSARIVREFAQIGFNVQCQPQQNIGDLFVLSQPPSVAGNTSERILLLTHVDTVWPVGKINEMPFNISGNKISGPGVLDMKSGIVMAFFALKAMQELNLKPRKQTLLFLNSAEEIGHDISDRLVRHLAKKSTLGLCLEPSIPGGALKVKRKGRIVVRISSFGKTAHAGSPDKGINAIDELLEQLNSLKKLRSNSTSLNIGRISGGDKINMVADKASAFLDIRYWEGHQKDKVLDFLKNLKTSQFGGRIEYRIESINPPLEKTTESARLLARTRKIAVNLGIKLKSGKTGGSSDGAVASETGLPILDGLGPDGDGIHAENEHILLSSLIERTALLTELLQRL